MGINGAIASFATGTYTVTRTPAGSYVDGELIPSLSAPTTFQITASVHPIGGRTLASDDPAENTSEKRVVYSDVELRTRAPGQDADSIEIDGEAWSVIAVERWQHWGTTHWVATISRDEVS